MGPPPPNRGVSLDTSKAPGRKMDQQKWRESLGIDPSSHIRLVELNHLRYQHSDIPKIVDFLQDFGFTVTKSTDDEIYFRGYGPQPYAYVVVKGNEPRFLGGTFTVESYADLERASKLENASPIQQLDHAPGGGHLVTLKDPAGWPVNLIFGQNDTDSATPREDFPELLINSEKSKNRLGACHRFTRGPAAVFRPGHFGICYKNYQDAFLFYVRTFNLVPSDIVYVGAPGKSTEIAAFLHIDRGEGFSDHHTFFLSESDHERVHHCSFEVHDHDTQLLGHEWLQRKGHKTVWGVGRHLLGSQIFDYWRDSSGFMIEHYADGDLVNQKSPVTWIPANDEMMLIWGPDRPAEWLA